jgi:hypothetical protein
MSRGGKSGKASRLKGSGLTLTSTAAERETALLQAPGRGGEREGNEYGVAAKGWTQRDVHG